jgi:stress responsive alpha/beta barrel protein
VIAHVVLFKPKADLTDAQRRTFVDALERALLGIPVIKRARVGRRRTLGRTYDAQNLQDFPFLAILEFDGESDLLAYLEHPAHRLLGEQFYVLAASALALDFELLESDWGQRLLS